MASCQQKLVVKHKLIDQSSKMLCLNTSTESKEEESKEEEYILYFETFYLYTFLKLAF